MRKWMCRVCGYVYDEDKGLPKKQVREAGWLSITPKPIEPGTRWEEIPKRFMCPECGMDKTEFKPFTGQ